METVSSTKKNYPPGQYLTTSYMPIQKKTAASSFDATDKKLLLWGCCRISIALISLVFFVAFVVTVVYVLLFTDLVSHLSNMNGIASQNTTDDDFAVQLNVSSIETESTTPMMAAPPKELKILVFVIDTRTHIMENGSFKATLESWRKAEAAWRDLYETKVIPDQLTVMFCQACKPMGVKDEDNMPTVFYTVEHFKGDTHSFNTVVFVALPTPPGEILTLLKRHARTNALGEICEKGTWSSTGCDFKVARGQHTVEKRAAYNFAIQVTSITEFELLKFSKTIIMQKDIDTFKVLINQPMAIR